MWVWNWRCQWEQPSRDDRVTVWMELETVADLWGGHSIRTQFPSSNIYKETPIYQFTVNQSSPRWMTVGRAQLHLLFSFLQAALHQQAFNTVDNSLMGKQWLPFAFWRSKTIAFIDWRLSHHLPLHILNSPFWLERRDLSLYVPSPSQRLFTGIPFSLLWFHLIPFPLHW